MGVEGRDRFRVLDAYVRGTHVLVAVAALIAPAITLATTSQPAGRTLLTAILVVLVVAGGATVLTAESSPEWMPGWITAPRQRLVLALLVLVAAAGVLLLVPGADGTMGTTAALPLALALRGIANGSFWGGGVRVLAAGAACIALGDAVSAAIGIAWEPLTVGIGAMLALGVLVQDYLYAVTLELDDLRTRDAEQAVATERRRFAGDLHDIQGQHLQLIAVEAELVTRLIANGRHEDAAEHAQRMRQAATDALDEMHRVVHDYRDVALGDELAGARRVLEAAGIRVSTDGRRPSGLTAAQDRLLGLTVREAVTNILKHTRASRCGIVLQEQPRQGAPGVLLTIEDSGPASTNRATRPGTGVRALQDRYREHDGELALTIGPGARLTAWLPLEESEDRP